MNRSDLVSEVSRRTDLDGRAADAALSAVLDAVVTAVAAGDSVRIPGFGTFEPRERNARTGRNPQTGAEIQIAATTVPGFRAGATFRDAVAEGAGR